VTDARYHRVDLLVDPLDAVLPAGHPLADPAGVRLVDLADQAWVAGYPGGSCAQLTDAVCTNAGFTADVRHHVGDWVALAALVAAGAGVALAPRLAQPLPVDGLAVVPVLGSPASRHFYAAVRAGSQDDPAIALVLQSLVEAADSWTARRCSANSAPPDRPDGPAQQPTSRVAR
jgi:DNA-binding transcriptional LysR family regulator